MQPALRQGCSLLARLVCTRNRVTIRPLLAVSLVLVAASVASSEPPRPRHTDSAGYLVTWHSGTTDDWVSNGPLARGWFIASSERTRWRWDFTIALDHSAGTRTLSLPLPSGAAAVLWTETTSSDVLLLGPTYRFRRGSRASPYLGVMAGVAWIFPLVLCAQPGAGVDIQFGEHLGVRVGADYRWVLTDGGYSDVLVRIGPVVRWGK